MENMKIYNLGRAVPDEAKKSINAGRLKGMTDINPVWRIKRLTEIFGPCGVGWWYEITDKHIVFDDTTKQKAAFLDIVLYYIDPDTGAQSHGIPGTGGASFVAQERNGPYLSDECYKMALTDAISVAAKAIGIGADVYYQKDRDKYNSQPETVKPDPPKPQKIMCTDCGKELTPWINAKTNDVRMTIEELARSSNKEYGRVLCLDCVKKELKQRENTD